MSWAGTNTSLTAAGVFTATSATITGTIEATAGYFGDATNGWTIQAGGIVAKTSSSLIDLAGGNL